MGEIEDIKLEISDFKEEKFANQKLLESYCKKQEKASRLTQKEKYKQKTKDLQKKIDSVDEKL